MRKRKFRALTGRLAPLRFNMKSSRIRENSDVLLVGAPNPHESGDNETSPFFPADDFASPLMPLEFAISKE